MGTAAAMLAAARDDLGMSGRPNPITREYAARHGDAFLRAPWCDMAVTHWARQSGNEAAVLPGGDRAYTVWHAQDFQRLGRWHAGTVVNLNRARPGDIVFFDWGETNTIGAIDHVGIVEKVLGDGRVQTIEGNTGDACRRRIRSAAVIAGYGRPAYSGESAPSPSKPADKPAVTAPRWPGRYLSQPPMMRGDDVRRWQARMRDRGWRITVDGVYGPRSEEVCRAFQREKGLEVDGVVGPVTWRESWAAPIT
ncbi:peptidoglycan-binding protein [Thermomonospora cellulosilytica]|uniref:Peptidoglycan hydrolase-like protein with peptidoglycan-binding domain n=1 Tax=Thermomonospora cellulosilytica TaxID=1411118 RepID=A0A7W3MXF7_9ACTN|nr:peptidoglycan-binding protein [Thermomonospora cellulosilytica]MBA9003653.1 peptidoglycan hydrolase-like protein with peptidoglycan-binding domain [Thermomonospora cellulosilytica]